MSAPDELLSIFRLCFLVLLYLFFFRVLRAVWTEVNTTVTVIPTDQLTRRQAKKVAKTEAKLQRQADKQAGQTVSQPKPKKPAGIDRLVVLSPEDRAGTEYRLSASISFGRSSAASVTIDDTFLSQRHASIDQVQGKWLLTDLGSTNGTFLNGVKIDGPVSLSVGDKIQLGSVALEVR